MSNGHQSTRQILDEKRTPSRSEKSRSRPTKLYTMVDTAMMADTVNQAPSPADRETIRALAARWAEIAALPVMAERKRAWRALHDLRPERPMVLFEVGPSMPTCPRTSFRCEHPVLRAVEATMQEHIHHFDEVGDDIVFEPYYRLGWDVRDTAGA